MVESEACAASMLTKDIRYTRFHVNHVRVARQKSESLCWLKLWSWRWTVGVKNWIRGTQAVVKRIKVRVIESRIRWLWIESGGGSITWKDVWVVRPNWCTSWIYLGFYVKGLGLVEGLRELTNWLSNSQYLYHWVPMTRSFFYVFFF